MKNEMSDAVWDSQCRRCGRCCYEKIEHDGRVYYTDVPCEHFDLRTSRCQIYSERHLLKPQCMPLTPEALKQGILPQDCPYVAHLNDYNAPQLVDNED